MSGLSVKFVVNMILILADIVSVLGIVSTVMTLQF